MNLIHSTVFFESSHWVALFERETEDGLAVAKHIFGQEPSDPEIYQFICTNYSLLRFSSAITKNDIHIKIKRKNPKRLKKEARKAVEKAEKYYSHAQETLRIAIEENKKVKKSQCKQDKELHSQIKFELKQQKKKQKKRGH